MRKYTLLLLPIFIVVSSVLLSCNNSRPEGTVKVTGLFDYYGRAIQDKDSNLVLIGPAAYIEFGFTGPSFTIWMKDISSWRNYNYIALEIDDNYIGKFKVANGGFKPFTFTTSGNGQHTARVFKATETLHGNVVIESIQATGLTRLKHPQRKKIEFIGNSITCGTGSDINDIPCGTGKWYDQHNAYLSYASCIARTLNADYMLSAVSGIGIYRTWNADGPSMPEVYEHTFLAKEDSLQWNFSQYIPDAVCIELGTNDLSDGEAGSQRAPFDSTLFIKKYVDFITRIYNHYPNTQIALLSSPMIRGEKAALLSACLKSVQNIANATHPSTFPIEVFEFSPMQTHGCGGHPTVEEQAAMAQQLIPFFTGLMDERKTK